MKNLARQFALQLPSGALALCAILNLATFFTRISPVTVFLPCLLMFAGAAAFLLTGNPFRNLRRPSRTSIIGLALLLVYAAAIFATYYSATGGASRALEANGQFYYAYKGELIRPMTAEDLLNLPNWWTRVVSTWIAPFALLQFAALDFRGAERRTT